MGNSKVEKTNERRSTREACAGAQIRRLTSLAGGLGGSLPTQRGARGAEPARICEATEHPAESGKYQLQEGSLPTQRGARGAEPARILAAMWNATLGIGPHA
jgi:hypothetical protein